MATYLGSLEDLSPEERKRLEEEIGELPEKLTLKVRTYFHCYICNKRAYMDEYDPKLGEQPVQIIIDRRRYRICKLCTSMLFYFKEGKSKK